MGVLISFLYIFLVKASKYSNHGYKALYDVSYLQNSHYNPYNKQYSKNNKDKGG